MLFSRELENIVNLVPSFFRITHQLIAVLERNPSAMKMNMMEFEQLKHQIVDCSAQQTSSNE